MGNDIRIQIGWRTNFIQQLRLDSTHRYQPPSAWMLGDPKITIRLNLGNGVAHIMETRHFLKKCIVTAGCLRATFDNMTCGKGTSERIVILPLPVEFPGGGTNDHRRVGDPRADHHISTQI